MLVTIGMLKKIHRRHLHVLWLAQTAISKSIILRNPSWVVFPS